MSNHLAVAAVTSSLQALVARAIQVVPGARATTVRPDLLGTESLVRGVNLFLYMASVNASFENHDTPTRNADGTLVTIPRTPLDLHYLVSFYGDEARFEPQILLGCTVGVLRQQPVLTAQLVQSAIAAGGPALAGSDLDKQVLRQQPVLTAQLVQSAIAAGGPALAGSDLDKQVPPVRVTPEPIDLDFLHKLWSTFFQVPYKLSVAYRCSVVLVDSEVVAALAAPATKQVAITTQPGVA
jgi:hypothetical protein